MTLRAIVISVVTAAAYLPLCSCSNPYALRTTSVEYRRPQTAGSITFTDPKLYKREALINERREEVTYYTTKIGEIDQVNFTPEIIREMQFVSTLSASVGLKFDPAAGLKFERDKETSGIQQDISTLKLQLQLDQLKRDAELMRAKLPTQDAPINPDLGKVPDDAAVTTPSSSVETNSLTQLASSVDALKAQLQTALMTAATPLAAVSSAASPFDTFNDRAAYRDLLNGTRNSASLDDLHDLDGAALIRFNLTATVLPPTKDYAATFGRLGMKVSPPNFQANDPQVVRIYHDWLWRLSSQMSVPQYDNKNHQLAGFKPSGNLTALSLASLDLFDLASFEYSTDGSTCPGVQFGIDAAAPHGCTRLTLAIHKLALHGYAQNLPETSFSAIYRIAADPSTADLLRSAIAYVRASTVDHATCRLPDASSRSAVAHGMSLGASIADAFYIRSLVDEIVQVDREARTIVREKGGSEDAVNTAPLDVNVAKSAAAAFDLLNVVYANAGTDCTASLNEEIVQKTVPDHFRRVLNEPGRVTVYEMGPKSRVQVMSSVARAAEAISLAATVSGQLPGNGIGADGNVSYGRSAVGKADALERVPLVVAYAEVGKTENVAIPGDAQQPASYGMPTFGWLMGPRTTLDAKKKQLRLEQVMTPYDLSVDLSVPGAWPYLDLVTEAVWAPDWQRSNLKADAPSTTRTIRVPLAPTTHDLDNLTGRLLGSGILRDASIDTVVPSSLSACVINTAIEIDGDNIWRATQVVIGGRTFEGDAVKVLPDMRGLLVQVDKATFPVLEGGNTATITALTPYGPARHDLTVTHAKEDGGCKTTPGTGGAEPAAKVAAAKAAKTAPKPAAPKKPAPAAPKNPAPAPAAAVAADKPKP